MPTYSKEERFIRDLRRLSAKEREQFALAAKHFVYDLKAGEGLRKGLRVKGVQGHEGVYEMTWAPDGRATFAYGTSPNAGDAPIIWRRIGSHKESCRAAHLGDGNASPLTSGRAISILLIV